MQNFLIYIAIVGIMFQAGCGTMFDAEETTPAFGSSVRMGIVSQTANPGPASDAPVIGLDGKYAAKVIEKHQEGPRPKSEAQSGSLFGIVEAQ
jgi:hypothetical protein